MSQKIEIEIPMANGYGYKYLYKFKSCDLIKNDPLKPFRENKIYLNSVEEFSDLSENLIIPNFKENELLRKKYLEHHGIKINTRLSYEDFLKYFKLGDSIEDNWNKFKSRYGIYSLSKDWNNISMWDSYSSGHSGYCIEFDDNYFRNILNMYDWRATIHDVRYVSTSEEIFNNDPCPYESLISKHKHYSWEKECRLIKIPKHGLETTESKKYLTLPKNCISKIIFGLRCKDDTINTIKQSINKIYNNPKFYKIKISQYSYNLEMVKL